MTGEAPGQPGPSLEHVIQTCRPLTASGSWCAGDRRLGFQYGLDVPRGAALDGSGLPRAVFSAAPEGNAASVGGRGCVTVLEFEVDDVLGVIAGAVSKQHCILFLGGGDYGGHVGLWDVATGGRTAASPTAAPSPVSRSAPTVRL